MASLSSLHRIGRAASQTVNASLARGARSYPSVEFVRDGFVVRPEFLPPSEVEAVMADVRRFGDRAVRSTGVPGARLRDRADRQTRDLNVRQLTGAEHLSPVINALYESGRIEHTFRRLTGIDLSIGGITVQIDWPDSQTKRGLHVDSHWPPTYKAFIYLSAVTGPEHGAFTVVPGSHRDRAKKVKAVVGDYLHREPRTDVRFAYSFADARCLLGSPGTAIFADQRLAHAGWPEHTTRTRFMLVTYLYLPDHPPPSFLGSS